MDEANLEILSSFVDGEAVETPRLLEALGRPGALEALIEFVRLRLVVEEDSRRPRPEFVVALAERLEPRPAPWWRRLMPLLTPAAVAAAALVVFSFWPTERPAPRSQEELPPPPARVLYFEEGVDWRPMSP